MRIIWGIVLSIGLAGCTVIESNRAGAPFLSADGTQKRTSIQGSYSLARKYLSFNILADNVHFAEATHFKISQATQAEAVVPDPSAGFRYTVNYQPSRFSNDDVDIEFADQLLKSVTVATDDQSGKALINFAEAAARIARLSQGLTTTPGGNGTPGGNDRVHKAPDQLVAQLTFDPTDPESVKRAQHRLGRFVNLRVHPAPRPITQFFACNHALCYRPLTTVTVSFEEPHSGNITDFIVQVPDPHQIEGIDLERSAFVKRDTVLTFANGSLQKIDMNKPSEVAAAALLPIQVVDAVFTGIGGAVQGLLGLQQSELSASVELLNAQAAYLTALSDYRKSVDALGPNSGANIFAPLPAAAATPAPQPPPNGGDCDIPDENGNCPPPAE